MNISADTLFLSVQMDSIKYTIYTKGTGILMTKEEFIAQNPRASFLAVISLDGKEEFYDDRDKYICRLEELWCTPCVLKFGVLKTKES